MPASLSWDAFVAYEAKMRKKRLQEAEERERSIARLVGFAQWGKGGLVVFGIAFGSFYWSWMNYG